MTSIAIIGAGYVGLVSAACLARIGHRVVCADIDAERVELLTTGGCPIHEAGLPELLDDVVGSGRLRFVVGAAAAVTEAEVVFLCLPTPSLADGSVDTGFVEAAVREIAPLLPPGAIVVTKSTVPVGTGDRVQSLLARDDVTVAANPEFLREGTAVHDFLDPDRVIVGAPDATTASTIAGLYEPLGVPVETTDRRSAEMIKYASNAFLATKVSFVNLVAELCERHGADIGDVVRGIGSDPRIGPSFLRPGPGYGGSCLPKDNAAMVHLAAEAGAEPALFRAVIETNRRQFERVVAKVDDALPTGLAGARVSLLGLAFKAGTDDTRESPSLHIAELLLAHGAQVSAHDPVARAPGHLLDTTGFRQVDSVTEALDGSDAVVVATEWPEYGALEPTMLAHLIRGRVIVDTRNMLDHGALVEAGFDVSATGKPRRTAPVEVAAARTL